MAVNAEHTRYNTSPAIEKLENLKTSLDGQK